MNPDEVDEGVFSRIEAIIYSMTPSERESPASSTRGAKRRIAAAAAPAWKR